ncbi:hypothetical protein CEUSTIGMA_g9932.t1 [Chlamydomonas eustigma]|uniref:Glycolipid transfer protein domain-containing protein n=1 Tax=Chlamydomonas eustigma TaxID=1157962 RepID=A0A250XHE8_9CHLO|nr:hypothetical protein CEUSTIGMA_g9932.t1 [Chlamydomonas eustigma]|eukprot:GAX82505.1 hypothetical protein CEUSTIGMA_g9932.t1 [Chlamydomonas eustigma]
MTSALAQATSQIPEIKSTDGFIQTEKFLAVCRLVIPVIDNLGTAFTLVRSDINGNIQRLADRATQDPDRMMRLFALVQDEIVRGRQHESNSVTKGLLWLKRAMEFTVDILKRLRDQPADADIGQLVTDAYTETLLKFHGFVASSAFYLAFKFLPTREYVITSMGASPGANVQSELDAFVTSFTPILTEIHMFLVENNLDDPTKV